MPSSRRSFTITEKLTNLLQPLDVGVNMCYQEFYRSKFGEYISLVIQDKSRQTKAGNPKVPRYDTVAQWTRGWVSSKSAADIKKAFCLCGLVAKEAFQVDQLHAPLRWRAGTSVCSRLVNPEKERGSLFCYLSYGSDTPHEYASVLTNYMATLDDPVGLLDEEYIAAIRDGNADPAELEIYAESKVHGWNINLQTVDDQSRFTSIFTYTAENATRDVFLVRGGGYFAAHVDGYLV
ncbi:unnamed protein product [Phytophthora fragariaefolia]|uniref:Unnamed protein product n=1 Tax=Phytophthora fragariaefolia TaxID=1490495 RepID=A0A9W6XP36_9STRA|nr:unnamed protein product [Phytophthora fragariaefolia]